MRTAEESDEQEYVFKRKDIVKITFRTYPDGIKWTTEFANEKNQKYTRVHYLKDHSGKDFVVMEIDHEVEVKEQEIKIEDGKVDELPSNVCSIKQALSEIYQSYPELETFKLAKEVRQNLPHGSEFELKFTAENTEVDITTNCQVDL